MTDDLEERVAAFKTMSLPGQPMMMHMGTSYLVGDLERAWKAQRARAEAAEAREARLREALEWIAEEELSEPNPGNRNDLIAASARDRARAALRQDEGNE